MGAVTRIGHFLNVTTFLVFLDNSEVAVYNYIVSQ